MIRKFGAEFSHSLRTLQAKSDTGIAALNGPLWSVEQSSRVIPAHIPLCLSGFPGEHIGQGMGKVIPLGKVLHRLLFWCQWPAAWQWLHGVPGYAYKKPPQNFRADMLLDTEKSMGPMAGVAINSSSTRRTWRLDAGDGVQGLG